jgi:hypothetical protein
MVRASSWSHASESELSAKWKQFKTDIQSALHQYGSDPGLRQVFSVLAGDVKVISRLAPKWQEALVAVLLYKNPMIQPMQIV